MKVIGLYIKRGFFIWRIEYVGSIGFCWVVLGRFFVVFYEKFLKVFFIYFNVSFRMLEVEEFFNII